MVMILLNLMVKLGMRDNFSKENKNFWEEIQIIDSEHQCKVRKLKKIGIISLSAGCIN